MMSYMDWIKSTRLVPGVELISSAGDPDYPGTVLEVCDREDKELFNVVIDPRGEIQVLFFAHEADYRLPLDVLERIVAVAKENVRKVDLE